jgi:hypothetical protein
MTALRSSMGSPAQSEIGVVAFSMSRSPSRYCVEWVFGQQQFCDTFVATPLKLRCLLLQRGQTQRLSRLHRRGRNHECDADHFDRTRLPDSTSGGMGRGPRAQRPGYFGHDRRGDLGSNHEQRDLGRYIRDSAHHPPGRFVHYARVQVGIRRRPLVIRPWLELLAMHSFPGSLPGNTL